MSLEGVVTAVGAILTAAFTGVTMIHGLMRDNLRATCLPDGGFKVVNPGGRAVVIHQLIAGKGTLWARIEEDSQGRAHWGDSGKKTLEFNRVIEAQGEALFHNCLFLHGEMYWAYARPRRLRIFHPEHVHLVLSPGGPISEIGQET